MRDERKKEENSEVFYLYEKYYRKRWYFQIIVI